MKQRTYGVAGSIFIAATLLAGCGSETISPASGQNFFGGSGPTTPTPVPVGVTTTSPTGTPSTAMPATPTPIPSGQTATPATPSPTPSASGGATNPPVTAAPTFTAAPTAVPTVTPLPTAAPTATPASTPTPAPPIVVMPTSLNFTQPGQVLTVQASEAAFSGNFVVTGCNGIVTTANGPAAGQIQVTSVAGGTCTLLVADGIHTGNSATVSVVSDNNGFVIEGSKR